MNAKRTGHRSPFSEAQKYQPYKERPSLLANGAFLRHVHTTAMPETFPGLHPGPIPKTAKFIKLLEFEIPQLRRPQGDRVPCPMCQPNKYLKGWLVWFPDLQAIAAIGHCCADQLNIAEADRIFRAERTLREHEDFLLSQVPLVPAILEMIQRLRPCTEEVDRVYRKFSREGTTFHKALRKASKIGRLTLAEQVKEDLTAAGPSGLGTGGRSRTIEFGILQGHTALLSKYHPVIDLARVYSLCEPHNVGGTETQALDYIVTLNGKSRKAVVVQLSEAKKQYERSQKRLADFTKFFLPSNVAMIDTWASHPANQNQFEARVTQHDEQWSFTLTSRTETFRVILHPVLWDYEYPYPKP